MTDETVVIIVRTNRECMTEERGRFHRAFYVFAPGEYPEYCGGSWRSARWAAERHGLPIIEAYMHGTPIKGTMTREDQRAGLNFMLDS